jgi:amino acid transporter
MHKLSIFSLVLLVVAAIDSIRNLPVTAIFGSSLIFFFLFSALIFLIPISLVSAEFASRFPKEGGTFHWVRHAFGERIGVLAVWLQWINTMVWYPTILSFIAGTAAYLINPALAHNKLFLSVVILLVFWTLTLLNFRGIHISAKINSYCSIFGTLLPIGFLILLGLGWLLSGRPVQISFGWDALIPSLGESQNWASLIAIMASYLGMELSGVHVSDIDDPQKNYPKAMFYAVLILLGTMIFGSLAIAILIPKEEIHFVDGVMQTFSTFFEAFGISFILPILAVLIVLGSSGSLINWLLSPAKGLVQASQYGYLPPFFTVKNERGVPVRILFAQAILVSLFCGAFIFVPSINAFYWFLTALSTGLYMLMYILLFLAALKLGRPDKGTLAYRMPKGIRTMTCLIGLFGCILTIVIGFDPPEGVDFGGSLYYAKLIAGGNLLMIAPVILLWIYQKYSRKNSL